MRKATDQRDAQTMSLLWTSLLLFHGGDVTCFDACHVIWCGGHVIRCDVIACVVSCHVMQCDVMWCALQWSRCVFEVVLWQCGDPKYYSVLQSTIVYYKVLLQYYSVLHSTTTYYFSTTLYYKVLLQYYSVLQSTTPVLLCTTKYYSSTTLYYKVLLQYYSVLHSTTTLLQYYPVLQSTTLILLCTAKYYSSTTLYYKVLLQYYSVLHSTTTYYSSTTLYYKVLLQYFSVLQSSIHDWSLTHMNRYLHVTKCYACHEKSHSNFSKYCACHAKCISWLIRLTYETSFRMRGASKVNLEPQQILRLPRKMNLMIDPRLIWNVISNAQSKQSQPPTSANTAPATQNESHDWSASHMKRHLECAGQAKSTSNLSKYCACHAKWISWLIRASYETSFPMRRASKVNLQPQQILRLPRKMNPMINPRHTWNIIYNARSMHSQPPTSPNTAPATKSVSSRLQRKLRELLPPIERRFDDDSTTIRRQSEHEIVISHPPLRRPYPSDLEHDFVLKNTTFRVPAISQNVTKCCACHEKSHSNFTKYCACHAKCISWLIRVTYETSFRMRGASKVNLEPQQILRLPRNL